MFQVRNFDFFQKEFSSEYRNAEKTKKIWSVPITYTTSNNTNFNITDLQWLNVDSGPIEISIENNSWIVVNLQQTGELEKT